jgi:hypothetical protein
VIVDARLAAARNVVTRHAICPTGVLEGVIALAEECERVNVGIIAENAGLRAKVRQPEQVDLTGASTADLLAEVGRRTS